MTEPTDVGEGLATTSRRQFLREGGALVGAAVTGSLAGSDALAAEPAENLPPNIPEWMKTPGDPMGSQPYGTPSPFEKDVVKNISKTSAAISVRVRADAVAGSRRHHHAKRPVLRAPSWRRSHHRSGAAPADAAWSGRQAADLHHGGHAALSFGIAYLFPRMLGQPRLQKALWQDGVRPCRSRELRRMDRRQPEAGVAGSGLAAGRKMGDGGRRRCGRA